MPNNNEKVDKSLIHLEEFDYPIEEKTIDDILDELALNEEDRTLYKDIILHLDKDISELIQEGICVRIPTLGSVRKNPLHDYIIENRKNLKLLRQNCESSTEYKEKVSKDLLRYKQEKEKENEGKL